MPTTFEFSELQYKTLVNALQIAGIVYGVMGDTVDKKYKRQSDELDELEYLVLEKADENGMTELVEEFNGKKVLTEEGMQPPLEDLGEYEEYSFWELLGEKFADRDLTQQYSKEELSKMDHLELLTKRFELQDRYWKEFEENGLDHVQLKDS